VVTQSETLGLDSPDHGSGTDPVEPIGRGWRPAGQTIVVFLSLLGLCLAAFGFARSDQIREQTQILEQRATEVAALLAAATGEIRSALTILAVLADSGDVEAFETAGRSLTQEGVRAVGLAELQDGELILVATTSEDLLIGDTLTGDQEALGRTALETEGLVSQVIDGPDGLALGFAMTTADRLGIVFRETPINPAAPATTVRGQAFNDIDLALYASPTADPKQLILSTVAVGSLGEETHELKVPLGGGEWLLIVGHREVVGSTFTAIAPWAVLALGVVVTAAIASLVETIIRRRAYALAIVEQRTAALQESLREQSALEASQRRAREEAEDATRSKNEFLSRMSHELRTPLNGVLGFAQLLEMDSLPPRQQESVAHILKGGRHLLALINEILDVTRIETGEISLSPEPVLANDVIQESIDLVRPLAAEHGVNFVSGNTPACDVHVFADHQRLKQILLNLLSNAIKYNRTGGTIAVSCGVGHTGLRINVTDTGPGIRPEHLGLLFTPFERLGAENTGIQGTGIGLALSRRLAEAMGGTLEVETELGRGSTFWVDLPLVEGPVERYTRLTGPRAASIPSSDQRPDRRKLLYIEDNLSNLRLVERMIEQHDDIELVAAMQGGLGLELAQQHRPTAILLDLHLPDIGGDQVLHQLRNDPITASIPVVIVSADATQGQVQRLLAAGAHSYITKPIDVPAFRQLITDLFGEDEQDQAPGRTTRRASSRQPRHSSSLR
jgi:signal transduction histidine kinase/FixJ family two-component response regulator